MYEQKSSETAYFKIFGIKILEVIKNNTEVFEREFTSDDDTQPLLYDYSTSVYKFFGIPIMKFGAEHNPNSNENESADNPKFKINLTVNKIVITVAAILVLLITFACGIFTANSEWFNDLFYIKSRQMQNLEIKSLKQYDKALSNEKLAQYEINNLVFKKYEQYHQYYEKVVERIRNHNFYDETVKSAIISYLDGYDKRKAELDYTMFPCKDKPVSDCGYGTAFGSIYPKAMLEFDRQELLTYRMILTYMYGFVSEEDINNFFEE